MKAYLLYEAGEDAEPFLQILKNVFLQSGELLIKAKVIGINRQMRGIKKIQDLLTR